MKREASIRFRFVGNSPRLVVASPYYTLVEIIQIGIGVFGVFAIGMGAQLDFGHTELAIPAVVGGIVCILLYISVELALVHAESVKGRLSLPGPDISEKICRIGHHAYHPQGMTTRDRQEVSSRHDPPRMIWECARCGEKCHVELGVSPD